LDSDILDLVKSSAVACGSDAARKAGITWKQNMASPFELEWTAGQADHDIRILRRNYREVVSRQEAEAYFRIGSSPIPAISS
jgi:hypothetical protein